MTTTLQEGTVQKWVMQIKDTAQLQVNTENEQQKPRQYYSTTNRIKIETVRHGKFPGYHHMQFQMIQICAFLFLETSGHETPSRRAMKTWKAPLD